MKIIITESQLYNLIPQSLRRRMKDVDFDRIDDIIESNLPFFISHSENIYDFTDDIIRDSLHEFVMEYKLDEYVVYNREDNEERYYEEEENKVFEIFQGLIPFLKMKYKDELFDYYTKHKK